MTSTNMFQGLDTGSKPSSRVLRPPGGASSNLFGGYEEEAPQSRRPNKMASNLFGSPEEPQAAPRRSNPPGGKSSGIFGEPEPPVRPQRPLPPGGPSSNIFGSEDSADVHSPSRSHPNKPKDNLSVVPEPESPATEVKVSQPEVKVSQPEVKVSQPEVDVSQPEVKEQIASPVAVPAQEEPIAAPATPEPGSDSSGSSSTPPTDDKKNHEPHLGPKPRSHNRVLNPPGGKSSVVFY
ncbi:jupiter microtubule associated homolog 2 isoform X3 [Syngnathus acus]|uniref:jupiter microtubule associated homolog 2 isoform X2 n=1 Tax=Syngnathus acus TaxID=161584 RepID=UPI001885E704|nr:jupiter microtubule associated homolog 2 isoform X2 [Syngnathus acus]XP_037112195.1 jupiter microtubule associated homolog 2 isoform X3 [Syngnathus acus]